MDKETVSALIVWPLIAAWFAGMAYAVWLNYPGGRL